MRYLSVEVYGQKFDPTNQWSTPPNPDKLSENGSKLFIESREGNFTDDNLIDMRERGEPVVVLRVEQHPTVKDVEYLVDPNERGQKMFGGNFIWSSDSRVRRILGQRPMPLHDHVE